MKLTSPSFQDYELIPTKFTCEAENVNPRLDFSDVPQETQSLVLIVEDPDSSSQPWTHWLLFNISTDSKTIEENSLPQGAIEGISSSGTHGWEGPCPPDGIHKYVFRLYALDTLLNLDNQADKNAVLREMDGHILDVAQLVGKYHQAQRGKYKNDIEYQILLQK